MIKKIFILKCKNHPEEIAEYKINKIPLCRTCAEIVAGQRDSVKLELQNFKRNSTGDILYRSTFLLNVRSIGLRNFNNYNDDRYLDRTKRKINGKTPEEIRNYRLAWVIECELTYDYGKKELYKFGSREYEKIEDGLIYLYTLDKKECLILDKYYKPIRVVKL